MRWTLLLAVEACGTLGPLFVLGQRALERAVVALCVCVCVCVNVCVCLCVNLLVLEFRFVTLPLHITWISGSSRPFETSVPTLRR